MSRSSVTGLAELHPVHALAVVLDVGAQNLAAEELRHGLRKQLVGTLRHTVVGSSHHNMITVIIMF